MTTIPERRNASSDNIPDHIWEEARQLRNVVNWTSNASVEAIAMFLLAAEKRGREEAAKQMAELKEERDLLLEIGSKAVKFQLGDVFVESRGLGIWAVCNGGCVRNVLGEWEYEPFPSGRDDEFIARTRFPFAEAWEIATAIRSTN